MNVPSSQPSSGLLHDRANLTAHLHGYLDWFAATMAATVGKEVDCSCTVRWRQEGEGYQYKTIEVRTNGFVAEPEKEPLSGSPSRNFDARAWESL